VTADHEYLSTACWHALFDGNQKLHGSCRSSCKFCTRHCGCSCHPQPEGEQAVSWVDQARDVALALLAEIEASAPTRMSTALRQRIETDPALFWLRGEEQPNT
jgi:hypothetical protein